jgi:hypothetical protein
MDKLTVIVHNILCPLSHSDNHCHSGSVEELKEYKWSRILLFWQSSNFYAFVSLNVSASNRVWTA